MPEPKPVLEYRTPPQAPERERFEPRDMLKVIWAGLFVGGVLILLRLFLLAFVSD
jgi:hypothetical protein